jgi:anti-sigma regulatory factor (Ser/Thr protein kinase)
MILPRRQRVALVPSPFPAPLSAAERMYAALQRVPLRVDRMSVGGAAGGDPAATDASISAEGAIRRLAFFNPCQPTAPGAERLAEPPPVEILLEIDDRTSRDEMDGFAEAAGRYDIFWSLTTECAMRIESPARTFADVVARLAGDHDEADMRVRVETALHEVLANALVHGNLGLPSLSKLEGDDQSAAYQHAVETGLADPDRAKRRVDLSAVVEPAQIWVGVRDEGHGVPLDHWRTSVTDGGAALSRADKSGRGLYLTAMFCDWMDRSEDGRLVRLGFGLGAAGDLEAEA